MNKSGLLFLAALVPMATMAQMAVWTIPPKYDNIEMALDNAILLTDSAGISTVWSKEGQRLFTTEDKVNKFVEDKAVVTDIYGKIKGFIDRNGRFHELPDGSIAYDYPYYSDGFLCVQTGRGYGYFKDGGDQSEFLFFDRAYPFFGGYATYLSYKQPEKKKDVYYNFYTVPDKIVNYTLGGKRFDYHDIQFLSSVSSDSRAIAVIKGKVYWFDANTGDFTPMYGGGIEDKKNHVEVEGKVLETINPQPGLPLTFTGRYGKTNRVEFSFDNMLRPETIIIDDRAVTFPNRQKSQYSYQSPLTITNEAGKKGLDYSSTKLLPPQFEDISLVYDDYALAKIGGKWGLLKMLPDVHYSFIMNNGKDIGFRHETFETQVRLDLPKDISSNDVDFDVAPNAGCKLDKRFMEAKDTRAGNFLQYNCVLTIPDNLPATLTDIVYPVDVVYNGLHFYEFPLTVKGWHLKSYNVNIDDDEVAVQDGRATFTVDIVAERKPGEPDYPFVVQARSDMHQVYSEKISETRYKYTVDGLQEGANHLDIVVTEKGCPSAVFPVEIEYVKPTKRGKEEIMVKKKDDTEPDASAMPATPDASAMPATPAAAQPAAPAAQPAQTVAQPAAPAAQPAAQPEGGSSSERYVPAAPVPVQQVQQPAQDAATDSIKNANLLRFLEN